MRQVTSVGIVCTILLQMVSCGPAQSPTQRYMYPAENSSPRSDQPANLPVAFRPLVLSKGKLEYLWAQMRQYPQVFDDVIPRTFEAFKDGMMAPTNQFYEFLQGEDTIGLAAATQVRVRLDANMHLVLFDRRLRGREDVIKAAMLDFARRAQLRRMTVSLPEDNKTAIKLVQRLGYKLEGVMRKAHLRDGIYRDYHIYGILGEELMGLDSDGERPGHPGGDGVPIRGPVREGPDEVPSDSVREEDEGVHAGGDGDSPDPAREVRPEGGDSGPV